MPRSTPAAIDRRDRPADRTAARAMSGEPSGDLSCVAYGIARSAAAGSAPLVLHAGARPPARAIAVSTSSS